MTTEKNAESARLARRDALAAGLALGAAALATGCEARAEPPPAAPSQPKPGPSAPAGPPTFAGAHSVVPLPFTPTALKGLSERLIVSHHEKNYTGAVKNLNRAEREIASLPADAPPFVLAGLHQSALTFRNSKLLHEAYFASLGGDGRRSGAIEPALAEAYGTSAAWEEHARRSALGLGGGSGWVVLAFELETSALRTIAASNHTQALASGLPLLVLDMYEHSYHMDFGASVPPYIDAFFANVKWDEVNRRLERARKAAAALRA